MAQGRVLLVTALVSAVALAGCSGTDEPAVAPQPTPSPHSLAERAQAVESVAAPNVDAGVAPGVVVVLADDSGQRALALGVSDRAKHTPMSPEARFKLAGPTAPMTAAVVLQLAEDRVLDLEDTVETWLPGLLRHGDRITLAEVLAQTGGLPDPDPSSLIGDPHATVDDYVGLLADEPLESEPGEEFRYSNAGYALLGLVVEKATGRPLEEVLRERLFDPLGMSSTRLPDGESLGSHLAHGYEGRHDVTDVDVSWVGAAGALVGSADDVSLFLRGLFGGAVVPLPVLDRMTDMRDVRSLGWNGFGLGLARVDTDCGVAYGQSGRVPGYVSDAWFAPDSGRSVVVEVNGSGDAVSGTVEAIREAALCD